MDLLREKVESSKFEVAEPRYATDEDLLLIHDRACIDFLQTESKGVWLPDDRFLSPDTPLQPGMEKAARLIVGATLIAAEIVWKGKFAHAVGVWWRIASRQKKLRGWILRLQ